MASSAGEQPTLELQLDAALLAAEGGGLELGSLISLAERLVGAARLSDVATLYQRWLSHTVSPLRHIALFNLAVVLGQLERLPEAEATYRKSIEAKPDFIQGWFNLGTVLERQGRGEHALVIWQSMLDHPLVSPNLNRDMYLLVVNSMGRLQEERRQFAAAEEKLEASLKADPAQPKVIQHWFHLRQKQCKWPALQPIDGLTVGEVLKATSPLGML